MATASIAVRAAVAADQPAITALVRAARINPTGLDWRRFLVAEAGGRIVGVGQVKPHGGVRELASIAVVPEWRGRGVARAIITALLAREPGDVYLYCSAALAPFYERFGFQAVAPAAIPPGMRWAYRLMNLALRLARLPLRIVVMRRAAPL
jgi:N-acetylglutamate synthase-like GNAT family acetyltransferase